MLVLVLVSCISFLLVAVCLKSYLCKNQKMTKRNELPPATKYHGQIGATNSKSIFGISQTGSVILNTGGNFPIPNQSLSMGGSGMMYGFLDKSGSQAMIPGQFGAQNVTNYRKSPII